MHVYHYAAYEKSTLLRLAGRYGVGENDVDELLRNGVLVDLYPLVRKSIRVGTESYSIKYLEPLYMGNELRSGEVTTATDSITQYARYCALRDEGQRRRGGDRAQGDRGLQPLRLPVDAPAARLADGARHRIRGPAARPAAGRATAARPSSSPTTSNARCCKFAGDGIEERTAEQTAVAMVAAARGFPQARGQAVLVGPLRPGQQSRRRMGRQQRRVHRRARRDRRRLAPAAEGAQAAAARPTDRRDRERRPRPGHVRAVRPARTRRPRRRPGPARRSAR